MNDGIKRVLKIIAVVFVAIFLISQLYSGLVDPVTTDTVYTYSSYNGFETNGFIVRNETVVEAETQGILSYEVSDGGRVAKGGVIATPYLNSELADRKVKAAELQRRIDTLEKIQTYNDVNAADLSMVNANIHSALSEIVSATQNGKSGVTSKYDTLLENMARKQIITGKATDFNALISTLKAQCEALKTDEGTTGEPILSVSSGYVIYSVDGYESSLSVDELKNLTPESLSNVKAEAVPQNAVCKIVSDYEWYIAVKMPFDESLNLKLDSKVTLLTSLKSVPELTATVKYINKQSVGSDAVAVFSCDTMNEELAKQRRLDLTVVYSRYDGLKVDNRAIRMVDGVRGVYVLLANQVKFVPVNVIWSGENFSVVEREASEKKVLRIYDEIIVKGKKLYDGKIIN